MISCAITKHTKAKQGRAQAARWFEEQLLGPAD